MTYKELQTPQEYEAVYALSTICFSLAPWTKQQFLAEATLKHSHTIGIFDQEELIGFVVYHEIVDEVEILLIGVHPDKRNQKIATRLLEIMIKKTQSAQIYYLEVRASNQAALRLYESFGFTHDYTRKGYYQDPLEDAYLLKKESRKINE